MSDKKARTRQRILGAAGAALVRRGPLQPGVAEVMESAGLTVGGIAMITGRTYEPVVKQTPRENGSRWANVDVPLPAVTTPFSLTVTF